MLPASRAALAALAVSLAACSAKPPADDVASATCLPVIGVYPSWAQEALPLAKVRWDKLSHLGLVFALPRPDGSLDTSALDALIGPAVSNAHAQGVKVAVAIGGARGYGDAFQRIAESDERLTRFTREVSAWVQQHGIDGVDIDWEHWTRQAKLQQPGNDPVESRQLVRLLAAMRAALPREVQLSASIFAGPWAGPQYLPEIQQHVDFVNLMAFDFTGRWDSSPVGHHADFDTFQLALKDAVARGFARDKIVAGIPFYGKRFANGLNREVQDVPYRTLLPSLQARKLPAERDVLDDNTYFETPGLVARKAQLARRQGLAGLMLFELSMDSLDPESSLLDAATRGQQPARCATPTVAAPQP